MQSLFSTVVLNDFCCIHSNLKITEIENVLENITRDDNEFKFGTVSMNCLCRQPKDSYPILRIIGLIGQIGDQNSVEAKVG